MHIPPSPHARTLHAGTQARTHMVHTPVQAHAREHACGPTCTHICARTCTRAYVRNSAKTAKTIDQSSTLPTAQPTIRLHTRAHVHAHARMRASSKLSHSVPVTASADVRHYRPDKTAVNQVAIEAPDPSSDRDSHNIELHLEPHCGPNQNLDIPANKGGVNFADFHCCTNIHSQSRAS